MREILFRGKSNWDDGKVKKGDWLYSMTIHPHCSTDTEITSYYIGMGNKTIDGKTLGQYTGLTDKNGTKIFEGDIVKHPIGTFAIKFLNGTFCCSLIEDDYLTDLCSIHNQCEVIGNIHDNTELLKEREG